MAVARHAAAMPGVSRAPPPASPPPLPRRVLAACPQCQPELAHKGDPKAFEILADCTAAAGSVLDAAAAAFLPYGGAAAGGYGGGAYGW